MRLAGRRVAITGVGGFIGRRLVERCREAGAEVRGLDLSARAVARAAALGAEALQGDVCDFQALRRLCEGVDAVFHTAAVVQEGGDWDLFRRVNVSGSANVASAASLAGVWRMIHLSSVIVYGFDYGPGVTEDGPLAHLSGNPYCQTKIESEQAVLCHDDTNDLRVVIVRPGDVYGPGSIPWVLRPLEEIRRGRLMVPRGGVVNHVWIDNLIDGMFLALNLAPGGETFTISDGVATPCQEFFGYLARMIGRRPPRQVSAWTLKRGIQLMNAGAWLLRRPGPARVEAVDFLRRRNTYSIARAREVLGYAPRVGLDEGMALVADQVLRDA